MSMDYVEETERAALGERRKRNKLLMPITMCQQLYMFSSFNPSKKLVRSYILLSHFKDK